MSETAKVEVVMLPKMCCGQPVFFGSSRATKGVCRVTDMLASACKVASQFIWECRCGETFRESKHAWNCKKCRAYLTDEDYQTRCVTNLTTGRTLGYEEIYFNNGE